MVARVVVVGAETAHLARWQWKTLPSRQLLIERRQEHGSGRVLANQGCQINQVLGPPNLQRAGKRRWGDAPRAQCFPAQFNDRGVLIRQANDRLAVSHYGMSVFIWILGAQSFTDSG